MGMRLYKESYKTSIFLQVVLCMCVCVWQLTTIKMDILIEKLIFQKCPQEKMCNKSRMISVEETEKCQGDNAHKKHQDSFTLGFYQTVKE